MSDGQIKELLEKMEQLTIAMVGIGDVSEELTFVSSGYLK